MVTDSGDYCDKIYTSVRFFLHDEKISLTELARKDVKRQGLYDEGGDFVDIKRRSTL